VGHAIYMADGDLAVGVGVAEWADLDGDGEPDVEAGEGDSPTGYLVRFGPNREVRWARPHTIDTVWDVATDGERLLLAGTYEGERDLNEDGVLDERDGIGYGLDENRASELVLQVLSGDGRVDAVVLAPGLGNDSAPGAVFVPGTRSFYMTGSIQLTADFSGDRTDDEGYVRCDALGDVFLARYGLVEEPCAISLTATGRRGERLLLADLTWSGAPARTVDIYRDGELVATTENDGAFTDQIPRGVPGPYEYRITPTALRLEHGPDRLLKHTRPPGRPSVLSAFLFRISPADPLTLLVIALLFAVAGLAACSVPALRAARADPAVTLRQE